jgi:hypothetical protein
MVCAEDGQSYDEVDCAAHCEQEYGQDCVAAGCDASEADNPCGCEYGIVDGEPVDP